MQHRGTCFVPLEGVMTIVEDGTRDLLPPIEANPEEIIGTQTLFAGSVALAMELPVVAASPGLMQPAADLPPIEHVEHSARSWFPRATCSGTDQRPGGVSRCTRWFRIAGHVIPIVDSRGRLRTGAFLRRITEAEEPAAMTIAKADRMQNRPLPQSDETRVALAAPVGADDIFARSTMPTTST